MMRTLRWVAAISTASAAAVLASSERREAISRFGYSAAVGATIVADYKNTVNPVKEKHGENSEEYKAIKAVVDLRSAQKLLKTCQKHGGLYIKFAQTLSTHNHALPKEYTTTLAAAQDKAAFQPWSAVSQVVLEDTGRRAEDVFASIEESPIAAASLAQVHRAVTKDGQRVAVKIQYPHLRRQIRSDLAALRFFVTAYEWWDPDFGYTWLLPDFEASLRNEVNFLQEAHNGERVAQHFADDSRIHIPSVRRDLSSERVLVMEFIEGCKVNDLAALKALGVPPLELAKAVTTFFAEQIHVHGFVHCDPHAGNMMVRLSPTTGKWQLVVLDHGMYRRLTPQFRASYCRMWKALMTKDVALGERAAEEMGIGGAFSSLSLMLTYQPPDSRATAGTRMSQAELDKVKAQYSDVKAADINRFMQRLPRDLLFVMRNTSMVRGLNLELGGTSRQRFYATGLAAVKGLVLTDALEDFSATSTAFLKQQQQNQLGVQDSAALVSDVPIAGTLADSATPLRHGVWGALWDGINAALSRVPPVEPLTYLNALSQGAITSDPTESELQRNLKLSPWRRIALGWELAYMRSVLWVLDAAMGYALWQGSFTPLDAKHPGTRDLG